MIDFMRHMFGICGEPHPNVFYFIFGIGGFGVLKYYLHWIVNKFRIKKGVSNEK